MSLQPRYYPGDRIGGRYLVHKALMGGMGEVYLCLDLEERVPLALKTFQQHYLTNVQHLRKAFEQEVATWVALEKHPNVVRCFWMQTFDNQPFMGLEWVVGEEGRGTDLRSWLRRGPLDLKLALEIAIDICRGLLYAQTKRPGLVHRDLKPENILIAQGGLAKITDFGLAEIAKAAGLDITVANLGDHGRQSMIGGNGIAGTPAYMAPEQWRGEPLDQRTDIYAIGVILYELLTGRNPFQVAIVSNRPASYHAWLRAMQAAHEEVHPSALPSVLPTTLNDLINGCLAKMPMARPTSLADLLNQLTALYQLQFGQPPPIGTALSSFTADDYNNRGLTYAALEQHTQALADFNQAIQLAPFTTQLYSNRGLTYADLQQYEQALADYDHAIELDPANALAHLNRAITYADLQQYDQALGNLNHAIDLKPNLAKAYYNRGLIYVALKQDTKALTDFSRAIACNPDYAQAYYNRAVTYADLQQYEQAVADFSRALELDPTDARTYYNRGINFYHLQQHTEAIEDFNQAIRLDPNDAKMYYNRGSTFYALQRHQQALLDFERALELNSNDAQAYVGRGLIYAGWRQPEQALADYELALTLDPNNAKAYLNLGALLGNHGKMEEALPYFIKAAQLGDPQGEQYAMQVRQELGLEQAPQIDLVQQAFQLLQQADSVQTMRQLTDHFPLLVQAEFIVAIEQFIAQQVRSQDRPVFAQRLAWLKQIAAQPNDKDKI